MIRFTEREQLIERILRLPDDQVTAVAEFVRMLGEDPVFSDEDISAEELERRNRLDLAASCQVVLTRTAAKDLASL
jgi:hypothetical protein